MKLIGRDMEKLEYVLDIFKGSCLLNNYTPIMADNCSTVESIEIARKLLGDAQKEGKFFYYSSTTDNFFLEGLTIGEYNQYRESELINLALKTLNNIGIYDLTIKLDSTDEIKDNLDLIDLYIEEEKLDKRGYDDDSRFEIVLENTVLGYGGTSKKYKLSYFVLDYNKLSDHYDYNQKEELDVYINPKEKEVLSDAFAIATNLKDAGFKVEVNYEGKNIKVEELSSSFLITFDSKDIGNYKVHFKDLKTNEEREVMIDNIVEELSFF